MKQGINVKKRYADEWTKVDPVSSAEESHLITFEKAFDAIKIDEKFCKTISSRKFCIHFVNADDGKVLHT
jgi:hypothetical protein